MRRLGLVGAVLLMGCGSDPGSVLVGWKIGLNSNCGEAGIATIRITLTEEGGSTLGPFEASCAAGEDGATFKISDVDEGSYTIELEGLDAEGTAVYTGHSASRVNVSEGKASTPPAITLSPAPASLTIQWSFENGLGCAGQTPVPTTVNLLLFKSDSEEANETAECDASFFVFEDLEEDDNYDIQVTALDGSTPVYRFEIVDLELADGQQRTERGTFVSCDTIDCN